jgi:uncharacterized SAM-binding protein YcdF (DUF218 family)
MVFLLKLCALPLYPLGLSVVLVVIGIGLHLLRKRFAWLLVISGSVVLYITALPVFSKLVTRPFEVPFYGCEYDALPRDCSAIVVLGGGGMPIVPPRCHLEINDAGDRVLHAARLYKAGVAPRIVTTGGFVVGLRGQTVTEGEQNAMVLREIGVDSSAIIIERGSKVTADHGPTIGAILDSLHLPRKIILVTTATHMLRSVAVFKKHGFDVYPSATDFQGAKDLIQGVGDFFPNNGALNDVTAIIHEVYGIIGYKVMGKI